MAELIFDNVTKVYKDGPMSVNRASMRIPDGSFCVLVGPSGCGKTTLLRMVAGLEEVTDGSISIDGRRVNDLQPKDRDIAMVFQNYALYPHMNVYDNVSFSMKMRREDKLVMDERTRSVSSVLALNEYLTRLPRHLSGGQRQRVAMGRALVREPKVLLMDEPLSNLDAQLRSRMRTEIAQRHSEQRITTVYVTHDQIEAMTLGDIVAVMRLGVIQQIASPQTLFDDPANAFVASFIGSPSMNLVEGTMVLNDGVLSVGIGQKIFPLPKSVIDKFPGLSRADTPAVIIGIRPDDFHFPTPNSDAEIVVIGRVRVTEALGRTVEVHASISGRAANKEVIGDTSPELSDVSADASAVETIEVTALVDAPYQARYDDQVQLGVKAEHLYFFDAQTGESLRAH